MCKKIFLITFGLLLLISPITVDSAKKIYNILDFGAKPDGKTLCTQAIQNAVDQCAENGGGTVYFPAGTWLTGTIYMESHITIRLDSGCLLLGSKENAGNNITNFAVRGGGTIAGLVSN